MMLNIYKHIYDELMNMRNLRVTDTGEVFQFCHLYNAATNTQLYR
jgi:hypothetical protein